MIACSFEKVSKAYRSDFLFRRRSVLHEVSFEVKQGETFAYLGHNGAGKTTSIKAMLGLIRVDAGTVTLLGHRPGDRQVLSRIGYVPENPYFYDHLSGREFLQLVADLHRLDRQTARQRIGDVLELVSMTAKADQRMRGYSKGMLQRMGLGQALLNDPELLVLDEPMGGLDPMGRHQIRTIISELKARGKTIFMSSHILADVEAVADRAAILSEGHLRRVVDLSDDLVDQRALEIQCRALTEPVAERLSEAGFEVERSGENARVLVPHRDTLPRAVQIVSEGDAHLLQVTPVRAGLEEIFLREVRAADGEANDAARDEMMAAREEVGRILDHIIEAAPQRETAPRGVAEPQREEVHS